MARRETGDVKAHKAALAEALRLAGGDRARLNIERDGKVTVMNQPRTSPSPFTH